MEYLGDLICPHCESVENSDNFNEQDTNKHKCKECKKTFYFTVDVEYTFFESKNECENTEIISH